MKFNQIDQSQTGNLIQSWIQEALNMAVSCLELLWFELICPWIQVHGSSGMSKYYREKYDRSSVYFSLKDRILKSAKKYKNHWQVWYHRELKVENFVRILVRDSNLEPLDYNIYL